MGTFGCGLAGDLFLACRVKDTRTPQEERQ